MVGRTPGLSRDVSRTLAYFGTRGEIQVGTHEPVYVAAVLVPAKQQHTTQMVRMKLSYDNGRPPGSYLGRHLSSNDGKRNNNS